jgi:hypothetical protein
LKEAFFSRFRVNLKCHTDYSSDAFAQWLETYRARIKKETFE